MRCVRAVARCAGTAVALGLAIGCGDRGPTATEDPFFAARSAPENALHADQSNDITDGTSFGCGIPPSGNPGQSFIPAASNVGAVELRLRAGVEFPAIGVSTSIRLRAGSMTGPIVASSEAFVYPGLTVTRFHFQPPASIRPGAVHVIEWESPAGGDAVLTWLGSQSDTYARGSFIGCSGAASQDLDLAFTTYRRGRGPGTKPVQEPLAVTVTPSTATLQVGETVHLVATVTGGGNNAARTVTWSSSNAAVASVDANGLVTGHAGGAATVTATSTEDDAAKGAATITVETQAATPLSIVITSVRDASNLPVDPQNTSGVIHVNMNLQGSPPAVVSRVETLLDGTVVCTNAFSTASADVAEAEQANIELVCSVNTAAFDAATGETAWRNVAHSLQARAVPASGQSVETPDMMLVFNNSNFMNVTFASSGTPSTSLPAPRSLAAAGSSWHAGDVVVNLLSVNYGEADDAVATTTVSITSSGYGANGVDGCVPVESGAADADETIALDDGGGGPTADPDGAGPLLANPAFPGCDPATAVQVATGAVTMAIFPVSDVMRDGGVEGVEDIFEVAIVPVTAGGQAGPSCINPDPVVNPQGPTCGAYFPNPLRVDNLAPRVTQLSIERPPNQYFGPNIFDPDHAAGATAAVAGECAAPCARTVDYGVGGTQATFLAGPLSGETPVTGGGAGLEESETSEDYVFAVMLVDGNGNTDTRWATDPLETGADVSYTTDDGEHDYDILQFFGWDATAPWIEVGSAPDDMEVNPDEFVIDLIPVDEPGPSAGPAGFMANPFSVKARRLLPGATTCRNVEAAYANISCAFLEGFRPSDGIFDLPETVAEEGYFEYTVRVADAAGNLADEMVFRILEDRTAPTVGGINTPSTILGGQTVTFSAEAADNIELGSLTPYIGFGGVYLNFPHMGGPQGVSMIGELGFGALNDEAEVQATIAHMIRSLAGTSGGVPEAAATNVDEVRFHVRDAAGHQLRYVKSPWLLPDDGLCAGQNCATSVEEISMRVEDPDEPDTFGDLAALNAAAGNPAEAIPAPELPGAFAFNWGMFRMLGYTAGDDVVCNSTDTGDCPSDASGTISLEAIVQGPLGSFANPFAGSVWLVYADAAEPGVHHYIGEAAVIVVDDVIRATRTFRYVATWNAADLKVRPAGDPGTQYNVHAIGINAAGDALISAPVLVAVEGN